MDDKLDPERDGAVERCTSGGSIGLMFPNGSRKASLVVDPPELEIEGVTRPEAVDEGLPASKARTELGCGVMAVGY